MNKELDHDLINADILWVGEVHGIKENYLIYRKLIEDFDFEQVAIEYAEEGGIYQDGRFSKQSDEFLNWLKDKNIKVICFDNRNWSDDQ